MNLVKINSINIWDEEWEVGAIDSSGNNMSYSYRIRGKNYIPVVGGETYYHTCPQSLYVYYYDVNKGFLSEGATWGTNSSRQVPNNCKYIRITGIDIYGTTYNQDIQICLNSESQKTTYHPHWVLGLDGQGKALSVEPSAVMPQRIGCADIGEIDWYMDDVSYAPLILFKANVTDIKTQTMGIISSKYTTVDTIYQRQNQKISAAGYSWMNEINIFDNNYSDATSFKNANKGELIFYEKA